MNESPKAICEKFVDDVLRTVNTVQYLFVAINKIGGNMSRERIVCIEPTTPAAKLQPLANNGESTSPASSAPVVNQVQSSHKVQAGYIWENSKDLKRGDIALRADHITSLELAERSLRHELVHAFDDARGFVDPQDCLHHACSEIRAARLSGDCLGFEMAQNWSDPVSSGLQCVRRRAIMAVDNNPVCRSFSERAVEKTFPVCYSDHEPFVASIYAMGNYGYQSVNLETGAFEGNYFSQWQNTRQGK